MFLILLTSGFVCRLARAAMSATGLTGLIHNEGRCKLDSVKRMEFSKEQPTSVFRSRRAEKTIAVLEVQRFAWLGQDVRFLEREKPPLHGEVRYGRLHRRIRNTKGMLGVRK